MCKYQVAVWQTPWAHPFRHAPANRAKTAWRGLLLLADASCDELTAACSALPLRASLLPRSSPVHAQSQSRDRESDLQVGQRRYVHRRACRMHAMAAGPAASRPSPLLHVRSLGRGPPPTLAPSALLRGAIPGSCADELSHACTQHAWRCMPPCAAAEQRAAGRRAHRLRARRRSPNIARVRANGGAAAYVPRFCSLPRLSPLCPPDGAWPGSLGSAPRCHHACMAACLPRCLHRSSPCMHLHLHECATRLFSWPLAWPALSLLAHSRTLLPLRRATVDMNLSMRPRSVATVGGNP